MKDILADIAANKEREIRALYPAGKQRLAIFDMAEKRFSEASGEEWMSASRFSDSIKARNNFGKPGIIAEFKRRSPSKGDIAPMADVVAVEKIYEQGGAAASSVLTDTRYFGGSIADLAVARNTVGIPLLRKEFIIDEIQIAEAYLAGADAVLLIASLLNAKKAADFTQKAHSFGLEVIFEIHDPAEIDMIHPSMDMIGVNNRALASFHTDVNHSASLAGRLPKDKILVAESGIKTPADVKRLMEAGYNAFLIGETLMKAANPLETLKMFANVD